MRALEKRGVGVEGGLQCTSLPLRPVRATSAGMKVLVLLSTMALLAAAEADIDHIEMGEANSHDAKDMHFVIAVRDRNHMESILTKLQRSSVVMRAKRSKKAV